MTDKDLERLKHLFTLDEYVNRDEIFELTKKMISRLEAAERVCQSINDVGEVRPFQKLLEAWRKAAGK